VQWISGELVGKDGLSDVPVFFVFDDGEDALSVSCYIQVFCLLLCEFARIALSFEEGVVHDVLVEFPCIPVCMIGIMPVVVDDVRKWDAAFAMFWSWWEFEVPDWLVVCAEEHFDCLPFMFDCVWTGVFLGDSIPDVSLKVFFGWLLEVYWIGMCFHVSKVSKVFVDGDGFKVLDGECVNGNVFEGCVFWL